MSNLSFHTLRLASIASLACLVAVPGASLAAQETTNVPKDSAQRAAELGAVVVTATRSKTSTRDIPQKVDVIMRHDIEQTFATDVNDLLKRLSTIDVVQYPSLSGGVGIRGFRPETGGLNRRTMILINGRPSASINLATVSLDNVERIEVLKGASSSLYGANAMGGTINIITRNTQGPLRTRVSAAYGSYQMSDINGGVGGNVTPAFDFDVSIRAFTQGEYKLGGDGLLRRWIGRETATKVFPDGSREEVPDANNGITRNGSTYTAQSGSIRAGYALGARTRVDVSADGFRARNVRVPGDIAFIDDGNSIKNTDRYGYDATFSGEYGVHAPLLRLYGSNDEGDFYNDTSATRFVNFADRTNVFGVQLQDVWTVGRHTVTFGVDYMNGKVTSQRFSDASTRITPYNPDSKSGTLAAFVQGQWRALDDRLTGTIGGRLDRLTMKMLATPFMPNISPDTKSFTTFNPSAGIQYRFTEYARVHASAGRAFIAPTPYNMAGHSNNHPSPGVITFTAGNPTLDPESSVTYDIGLGLLQNPSGFSGDLTYFRTNVSDRITSVRATFPAGSRPTTSDGDEVSSVQTYVNASGAVMHGFEAEASYDFGVLAGRRYVLRAFSIATRMFSAKEDVRAASVDIDQFAGSTDFEPTDVTDAIILGAKTTARIRNVAPYAMTVGLEYNSLGRWSGRLTTRYVGRRLDTDFSSAVSSDILYAPFAIADLVAGMRVGPYYRVEVLVNNLTNENYYEKRGYNLPGRTLQLRISVDR